MATLGDGAEATIAADFSALPVVDETDEWASDILRASATVDGRARVRHALDRGADRASLVLYNCALQSLPRSIALLAGELEALNVCMNALESISPAVFALQRLRSLNVSRNMVARLPDAVSKLVALESLSAAKNLRLSTLPASLASLPRLHFVQVGECPLGELTAAGRALAADTTEPRGTPPLLQYLTEHKKGLEALRRNPELLPAALDGDSARLGAAVHAVADRPAELKAGLERVVECLQEDHTKLPALELAMRAATSVGAEVSISKQHSKARKALLTSDALQAVLLRAAERRDGAALRAAVLPLGIPFGEAVRHVRRKLTEAAEAPKAKKKNQNQSDPPVDLTALAAWAKELAISAEREEPCAPGDVADAFVAVVRKDLLKRADARSAKSKGVGLFGSTAAARGAAANNEPDMTAHVRKNCLDVLTGKSNHLVLPGCYLSKIPKEIARFDAANVVYLELTNNGLKKLPDELCLLTRMRSLRVGVNKLTVLPPSLGDCALLEEIYAERNHLTVVPPQLSLLDALRVIELAENPLDQIPEHIRGAPAPAIKHYLASNFEAIDSLRRVEGLWPAIADRDDKAVTAVLTSENTPRSLKTAALERALIVLADCHRYSRMTLEFAVAHAQTHGVRGSNELRRAVGIAQESRFLLTRLVRASASQAMSRLVTEHLLRFLDSITNAVYIGFNVIKGGEKGKEETAFWNFRARMILAGFCCDMFLLCIGAVMMINLWRHKCATVVGRDRRERWLSSYIFWRRPFAISYYILAVYTFALQCKYMFNGVTCLSCLITTATVWWTLKCQIECEALPRPNDWMLYPADSSPEAIAKANDAAVDNMLGDAKGAGERVKLCLEAMQAADGGKGTALERKLAEAKVSALRFEARRLLVLCDEYGKRAGCPKVRDVPTRMGLAEARRRGKGEAAFAVLQ